mgnify:CR=1 FL=1
MNYGAFGLVEVVGSSNAILVIDQMLKTSDVSFLTWQTKCGGHATVFLTGDVSAVTAAVESVKGNPPCEIVASAVISNPSEETVRLAEEEAAGIILCKIDRVNERTPVGEIPHRRPYFVILPATSTSVNSLSSRTSSTAVSSLCFLITLFPPTSPSSSINSPKYFLEKMQGFPVFPLCSTHAISFSFSQK